MLARVGRLGLRRSVGLPRQTGLRWLSKGRKEDEENEEEREVSMHEGREGTALVGGSPVNALQMNQYVVACDTKLKAVIVDCGAGSEEEFEAFRLYFKETDVELEKIILTHGHVDHVLGLGLARKYFPDIEIYMNLDDWDIYKKTEETAKQFGLRIPAPLPTDGFKDLREVSNLKIGALNFEVIPTPGHSPGHVCFYEERTSTLMGGDLLFRGSIGRTDFPTSCPNKMQDSLRLILELPDDVEIYPGHGQPTILGEERKKNPFLRNLN